MADAETLEKIERIARRDGKSKAAVIREALAEYIVETERQEPFENPLLRLVGLAGEDAVEMDLSDGKDEEILKEEWVKKFERSNR